MHWWLYVYLGAMGTIQVPGHFDTKADCMARGDKEVADYRARHTHSPAFRWCVLGGKADLH
jgi:hypothetical protein